MAEIHQRSSELKEFTVTSSYNLQLSRALQREWSKLKLFRRKG